MRLKLLLIGCLIGASFFSSLNSSKAESLKGRAVFIPKSGVALPVKNFGNGAKSGFHGSGEIGYFAINNFSIGFSFAVSQNNLYERNVRIGTSGDTLNHSLANEQIMQYGLNLRYVVPTHSRLRPFVQTGGGLYARKIEVSDEITFNGFTYMLGATEITHHFGWNYGGGLLVGLNQYISLLTTATYHTMFISNEYSDYTLEYLTLNGGLALFF